MIRLLTVVGARPQIIKAAAVSRAVRGRFAGRIDERILHTGQHYDPSMSQVFFEELGIPEPDYNLGVGSGSHGTQTARMIEGIERVLLEGDFDGILLYGDTNSTLAGAVAASKVHIPVFHVEAGLRSHDMTMPEEINRIVCDRVSSILFPPTQAAFDNLVREGFMSSDDVFSGGKRRKICLSGDIMLDNSLYYQELAGQRSDILSRLGLESCPFALATVHRQANTDDPARLKGIIGALTELSKKIKVVLPLHPRTKNRLSSLGPGIAARLQSSPGMILTGPVSFFDILLLEKHAQIVLTDSGGVQKESFFFGTPSVIFREETEWVEIVENGCGILAGAEKERILRASSLLQGKRDGFPRLFGDGHAAEKILECILEYLNEES